MAATKAIVPVNTVVPPEMTLTVGARSVGTEPSQSANRTLSGTVEPALTVLPSWNGGSRPVAVYSNPGGRAGCPCARGTPVAVDDRRRAGEHASPSSSSRTTGAGSTVSDPSAAVRVTFTGSVEPALTTRPGLASGPSRPAVS